MTDQSELPDPLTPVDCDLRGLPWMPLHTFRLLDSDLFILSTGDQFKAAVTLWCKSWNQMPGGSLPNNEKLLEGLSGSKSWKKVKEVALRGWILCSDGRLYHPVVAEQALQAWGGRQEHQEVNENKNSRQQRWREQIKQLSAQLRAAGITPPMNPSKAELERLIELHVDGNVDDPRDANVDGDASTVRRPVDNSETAKRGRGTEIYTSPLQTSPAGDAPAHTHPRVIEPGRWSLPIDWEPSPAFPAAMLRAGLDPVRFLTDEVLKRFNAYWNGTADKNNHSEWERKLLQSLIAVRDRTKTGAPANANRPGNTRQLSPFERAAQANPAAGSKPGRIFDVDPV